ncbi:hypothetical protein D9M73_244820 [compost metagenome]
MGHRADFDGLRAQQLVADTLGNQVGMLAGQLLFRRQVLRADHLRHLRLVLEALFVVLERRAEEEDRLALLDRRDPPGAEAATVAHAVDVVDHRHAGITGPQEIAVHGMHVAGFLQSLAGGRQ